MAFPLLSGLFGKLKPQVEPKHTELAPSPPPEPVKPRPEVTFPPEHPFSQLWHSYGGGGFHPPALRLEGQEGMTEEEERSALFQLQVQAGAAAKKHFEQSRPKKGKGDGPPIQPSLDAQVVVFVPRDGLSAWLLAYPPINGGKALDREALDQALDRAQVRFGVNTALLDSLPKKADRYFHVFHVAQGKPPVQGSDGEVHELFPRVVDRNLTVNEDNRVDYASLKLFHNVEQGEVICRIVPPTKGIPGRTVRDQELPARDGRPASVPKGRNTQFTEEGDALVASIAGQVEFSGRSFQVKPLLEIEGNVDFSSGNINFVGDVYIHGDICAGFTVRAMGNITVDGVVESSTVEAGGDLVVARGVQGDNQAVIRAHRNVYVKYLENCCVCVKESLYTDCIINCEIYCDDVVEVRSGRMTIIGGSIRAGREVSAGIIGSRLESRTGIILGGLPCGEFDYGLLLREAEELQEEMDTLERQPDSPQKLSRISKLRMKLIVARKKLEDLEKEKELLSKEASSPGGGCRMLCDTVYPGTSLVIEGTAYQFDRKLQPCVASLVDGQIILI